ncbi:hypothetical protein L6R52_34140, partial [Myxococcota bacterium]|nr:hypothetical protein [Myxococcota bacterium]
LALAHLPALRVRVERAGHEARIGGVAVAGIVLGARHWRILAARYDEELARFVRAVEGTRGEKLPSTFEGLKRFVEAGLDPAGAAERTARKAELEARLAALADELTALREQGRAPKGVVIYACGPDGAGKSSTGGIVMKAFARAGYTLRQDSFKAPTPEERAQHWLKRYERGVPAEGEAFFWDRGPAGDVVYGRVDPKTERRMAKELMAFEERLAGEGVLFVKVELHASKDRQAATFGKRLGRQHIADTIGAALEARGRLGPSARRGLDEIASKIEPGDLQALARYGQVQARYEHFIERTEDVEPWIVLDATKRHDARLALVEGVHEALQRFAARRGA